MVHGEQWARRRVKAFQAEKSSTFGHAKVGTRALVLETPVPTTGQCFWDVTLCRTWSLALNSELLSSPVSLAGGSNSQIAKTLTTKNGNEIIVHVLESLQQIWKPSSRMRPSMTYKSGIDSIFTCWSLPSTKAPWISPWALMSPPFLLLGPKTAIKCTSREAHPMFVQCLLTGACPHLLTPGLGSLHLLLAPAQVLKMHVLGIVSKQVSFVPQWRRMERRNHSTATEMPPSPGRILNRPQD